MPDWKALVPGPYTEIVPQVQNALSLVGAGLTTFRSGSYASLSAAVTAIGATPGALFIEAASFPSGATTTVPATLVINWGDVGTLALTTGHVVTIQSDTSRYPRRVLWTNALASQGTVLFTGSLALSDLYPEWWGAKGNDSTDCTAAFQAAIDSLDTSNKSGTIRIGLCPYVVAGPLEDTGNSNSQLIMPLRTSAMLSIRLAGYTPAPTIAFRRDMQGGVIRSTLASGTGAVIGGKVGGGAGWPIAGTTWLAATLENLTVRTVANPTISGVDFSFIPNIRIQHCQISTNEDVISVASHPPTYGLTEPTTSTSYALKLAPNNIPDQSIVDNVEIYGFYNGILAGELCKIDDTLVVFCKVGLEIPTALHPFIIKGIWIANYSTAVKFTGGASQVDMNVYFERGASVAWADLAMDVDDPNDYGHGMLGWTISDSGAVSRELHQTGAFFLWTYCLGNDPNNHVSAPMVQVHNSANISIANNTFPAAGSGLQFDTNVSDDPFAMHDTSTNTDRLVPTKEGIARIQFHGLFAANATGTRQVRIYKHSGALSVELLLKINNYPAISGVDKSIEASVLTRATDPGDYFYIQVWQDSGAALNLLKGDFYSPIATLEISR